MFLFVLFLYVLCCCYYSCCSLCFVPFPFFNFVSAHVFELCFVLYCLFCVLVIFDVVVVLLLLCVFVILCVLFCFCVYMRSLGGLCVSFRRACFHLLYVFF